MSVNKAGVNPNTTIADSPHVVAATNVRRGMTPAVWDATHAPDIAGKWMNVDTGSGPADRNGNVIDDFEDGPANWQQT